MFFKQVRSNAAKSRKDNGLIFGSLVVAIITFYTLLSLGDQDVMLYLKTIESDAVQNLMLLIPIIYSISLFFVFFLVYFAYRYQLDNRKKEFGLYLMLGMKRRTLFSMLMTETLWNSLVSILLGLPCALLLTEAISLTTAKLVGLGILGHKISFSIPAILGTVIGFLAVQMISMLFLSSALCRKEPIELLHSDSPEKQSPLSTRKGWFFFILGLLFLILAYIIGVTLLRDFKVNAMALILLLGGCGTFLFFRGLGGFIGQTIQRKSPQRAGLFTFAGRQIQENVLYQHKSLAISSLLLLMALTCISFGIGTASGRGTMESRTVDFSIKGSEQEVGMVLDSEAYQSLLSTYYPMFLSNMNKISSDGPTTLSESESGVQNFSWAEFLSALEGLPQSHLRDNMIENFSTRTQPHLISITSYNRLLQSNGKEPIQLGLNQVALYTSMKDDGYFNSLLSDALKSHSFIDIDGQKYELLPTLYYDNVVADRLITLYCALIVSDEDYQRWASDSNEPYCWNVLMNPTMVNEHGLMQTIKRMDQNLAATGLNYESYLSGIGRNLFYTVAASYLTLYLGVLFMIIANTVIGLNYLMQQRSNKRRYLTLLTLGADVNNLCQSARSQIRLFFLLVLSVAVCSSTFAIWSMFTSFLRLPAGTSLSSIVIIAGVSAILFVVVEYIYIRIVQHTSNREIRALQITDRSNAL